MSKLPWILGGGAVAAYLWHDLKKPHPHAASSLLPSGPILEGLDGLWIWPVANWNGRAPVISDGFTSPRPTAPHHGVDIMFRRQPGDPFRPGTPNGSKAHVMPDGVAVLAASDGFVASAMKGSRGYSVVLDHAPRKVSTFYTHLENLLVTPTARGASKQRVHAGQPLGTVGFDPTDPARLKHLHFEIWRAGPTDAIDPQPLMAGWSRAPDSSPALVAARNASKRGDLVHVVAHARSWPGSALRR